MTMSPLIQLLIVLIPLLSIPFLPHLRSLIQLIHSLKYLPSYLDAECETNNRKLKHQEKMKRIMETRWTRWNYDELQDNNSSEFQEFEDLNKVITSNKPSQKKRFAFKERYIDAMTQCSYRDFETLLQGGTCGLTSLEVKLLPQENKNLTPDILISEENTDSISNLNVNNTNNNKFIIPSTSTISKMENTDESELKSMSNDNIEKINMAGTRFPLGGVLRWRSGYKNGLRSQGRVTWIEDPDEVPMWPNQREMSVQYEENPELHLEISKKYTSKIIILKEDRGLQCEIIPSTADESWVTEARLRRRQHSSLRIDSNTLEFPTELNSKGVPISPNTFKSGITTLESCPWTFEVESVDLFSNVEYIIQRYFEQTLASLSEISNLEIELPQTNTDNKDIILILQNMRLRTIPVSFTELTNLTTIDISRNKLTTLPSWFFVSVDKTLQSFDLSKNYFFQFPDQFGSLKKLKKLNISYNKLQFFPPQILELTNLSELNVSHNSIIAMPANLIQLKLLDLDISFNSLTTLPETYSQFSKKLKIFRCQENPFIYNTRSRILVKLVSAMSHRKKVSVTPSKSITNQKIEPKSTEKKDETNHISHSRTNSIQNESITDSQVKDTHLFDEYDGEQNSRVMLLLELIEFEEQYLKHLNILFSLYVIPLQRHLTDLIAKYDMFPNIVTAEKIAILFPNELSQILTFSRSFIIQLREIMGGYESNPLNLREITNIGSLFMDQATFLETYYTSFIHVFDKSIKQLNDLRENCPGFFKFLKSRQLLPLSRGLDVDTFLTLPLSRTFYYNQFMKKFKKATSTDHVDFVKIRNASLELNRVSMQQTSSIFQVDNYYKIMDIQKKLKIRMELATPGRILVREGILGMASNRQLHQFTKEIGKYIAGVKSYGDYKKIQLNPYIDLAKNKIKDKTASDVVNDIWKMRLTDSDVHLYLFSDILLLKEMNMIHKLVGRVKKFDLAGASVYPYEHKSHKELAICLELKNGSKFVFVPENELQFLLWIRDLESVINELNIKLEEMSYKADTQYEFDELSLMDGEDATDDDTFVDFYD